MAGLVISDLDGTLNHPNGEFTSENLKALRQLGEAGYLRAVATGRSLFFARRQLSADFPIDYLIFSSGAGVVEWSTQKLLCSHALSAADCATISQGLVARELAFMLHDPVPDNHHFAYWQPVGCHPDFLLRCQRHASYARRWEPAAAAAAASQFLVVVAAVEAAALHEELRAAFASYHVIRATSPISRDSAWLEIFPAHVSKSAGAAWIAERHGISSGQALAIGNDYNDWDLLAWAGTAYVVGDAPESLRRAFPAVARHQDSGFAEAVALWLTSRRG